MLKAEFLDNNILQILADTQSDKHLLVLLYQLLKKKDVDVSVFTKNRWDKGKIVVAHIGFEDEDC